ncbi:hypothetical protein Hanom_Chr14g01312271 [Helianthus anomalus]
MSYCAPTNNSGRSFIVESFSIYSVFFFFLGLLIRECYVFCFVVGLKVGKHVEFKANAFRFRARGHFYMSIFACPFIEN